MKLGNSLIGAMPALLVSGIPEEAFAPVTGDDKVHAAAVKKRNKQERAGQQRLFGGSVADWGAVQSRLSQALGAIASLPETSVRAIADVRVRYSAYKHEQVEPARAAFDVWTAAFFWPLRADAVAPPTSADLLIKAGGRPHLSEKQWLMLGSLRSRFQFFHWPLEFPEVFERGGFDCVLGNPPWERVKLQEQEFFAERDPDIARAPNKAARQRLIDALFVTNPVLATGFANARRRAESESKFLRASGRFPLTAVGDVNVYAVFAEHDRTVIGDSGRTGLIVPTGIVTDDSTKTFFQDVVTRRTLASVFDFQNRDTLFSDVGHRRFKFCLLVLTSEPSDTAQFVFFARDSHHLASSAGFRCFTDVDGFKSYVLSEVVGLSEVAA